MSKKHKHKIQSQPIKQYCGVCKKEKMCRTVKDYQFICEYCSNEKKRK